MKQNVILLRNWKIANITINLAQEFAKSTISDIKSIKRAKKKNYIENINSSDIEILEKFLKLAENN